MENISDLQIGKAGEYLVCADLIMSGYVAFPSEQGLPFDVVAEVNGTLVRIQVKTTRTVRPVPQRAKHTPAYLFHVRRCGKGGRKSYTSQDFDVMALVALDTKSVAYVPLSTVRQTMHLNAARFAEMADFSRLFAEPVVKTVQEYLL